jgi:hypothetical protein
MNLLKAIEGAVAVYIFIYEFIRNKRAKQFGFAGEIRKPTFLEALKATITGDKHA